MRVLIACEYSGVVRDAFLARGHDAWSCDLLPSESLIPGRHHQCDVRSLLHQKWDQIIAHPDCTYICNSGVKCLNNPDPKLKLTPGILYGPDRWRAMYEACEFFRLFLESPCPRVCIENPIPHKYALGWIGTPYTQLVQPYEHGDPYTKATCFWLKGLPKLMPTDIVPKAQRRAECHLASPGPDRGKERARTYPGLARAMSQLWG